MSVTCSQVLSGGVGNTRAGPFGARARGGRERAGQGVPIDAGSGRPEGEQVAQRHDRGNTIRRPERFRGHHRGDEHEGVRGTQLGHPFDHGRGVGAGQAQSQVPGPHAPGDPHRAELPHPAGYALDHLTGRADGGRHESGQHRQPDDPSRECGGVEPDDPALGARDAGAGRVARLPAHHFHVVEPAGVARGRRRRAAGGE
ncbi:hypothetical protein [Frigoriglobus tundricola]|uniref:hypothetical protein n=1 Tax=Frigoriglobus tundricola TaxID=2774151 RepID=UPI00148EC8FA|nr:hypothetical protein [Frigoriglobus tundricola]